jgi:hypothetical protein
MSEKFVSNKEKFSTSVSSLLSNPDLTVMDAIMICAKEKQIEIERVPALLNDSIKKRLTKEAKLHHLLRRKPRKKNKKKK